MMFNDSVLSTALTHVHLHVNDSTHDLMFSLSWSESVHSKC